MTAMPGRQPSRVPSDRLATLPNALTVARLVAVPVLVVVLLAPDAEPSPGRRLLAAAVFVVAAVTDFLDGHLARSSGAVTRFGIVADPIADKGLLGAAFVCAALLGDLWWWVVAVVLAREVGVTLVRFAVMRRGLLPATRGGKTKTVVQIVTASLLLLPTPEALDPVLAGLVVVMVLVTIVTGAEIVVRAVQVWRGATAAGPPPAEQP